MIVVSVSDRVLVIVLVLECSVSNSKQLSNISNSKQLSNISNSLSCDHVMSYAFNLITFIIVILFVME